MDEKDEKILDILKKNGRKSYTDIADELGVSEGTIRNRVEKMQNNGVIENFTVNVENVSSVEAFVSVKVSTEKDFPQIIAEFPNNLDVYEVAGDVDIITKVSRKTTSQVNEVVDKIRKIDGVKSTKTYMVMSS